MLYESTEVAKLLLEVEGAELSHERELAAERRTKSAMEEVREASLALRYEACPHCGEELESPA